MRIDDLTVLSRSTTSFKLKMEGADRDERRKITWMPAWRIRELIGKRELSPVEVVDHFLGRIERYDPQLKAFAHLDPVDARARAKRAERAVVDGEELGPLHGIPVSVKGHILVEGWPTSTCPP